MVVNLVPVENCSETERQQKISKALSNLVKKYRQEYITKVKK